MGHSEPSVVANGAASSQMQPLRHLQGCSCACDARSHPFSTPLCAFLMKCMVLHTWPHVFSAMYIQTHTEPLRARSRCPVTTPHSPIQVGMGWLCFKTLHVSEKGLGPSWCCAVCWQNADAWGSSGISLVLSSQLHSEGAGSGPQRHCTLILEWKSQNVPTQGCF